ncbi:hypothetical protein C8J57DRAFT_1355620 [Mycena rebaudengoi]|nr:hypothetical protein C8J57DRAFT_1355620 [Mycena rebaudengoi]
MRIALSTFLSLGRTLHGVPPFTRGAAALPNARKPIITAEEADQRGKTNALLASLRTFIKLLQEQPQDRRGLGPFTRRQLNAPPLQIPSRPKIMETVIKFLLERRFFTEAVSVYYDMLQENLLPSPSTDALFLAAAMATPHAPEANQLKGFKTILSYPSFTETHFIEFLDHMARLDIRPVLAAKLTRLFISVKNDDPHTPYRPPHQLIVKLVELQTRAGLLDEALETVKEYEFNNREGSVFATPSQPYVKMLSTVSDRAATDYIMGVMTEANVPLDITIFNALIAIEVQAKSLSRAFSFYDVILRLGETTSLKPDGGTFKSLFRLLGRVYKPNYKPNASRGDRPRPSIPSPRQLYSQMMALYFNAEFHPPDPKMPALRIAQIKEDEALLHVALRCFLNCGDYPGAIHVLRSYTHFGIRVTQRTYWLIMDFISEKIRYDVFVAVITRRAQKRPLLTRALLDGAPDPIAHTPWPTAHKGVVEALLQHPGSEREEHDVKLLTPTYAMIFGEHELPHQRVLDPAPLERILSIAGKIAITLEMEPAAIETIRAAVALRNRRGSFIKPPPPMPPTLEELTPPVDGELLNDRLREKLVAAKEELLPPGIDLYKWTPPPKRKRQ